jgi:hypothetical protein
VSIGSLFLFFTELASGARFARTPRFAPLDLYLVSIGSLFGF